VPSVQARAPARREGGREFHAPVPDVQKERSPTVFNLKVGTAKAGLSDRHHIRTGLAKIN